MGSRHMIGRRQFIAPRRIQGVSDFILTYPYPMPTLTPPAVPPIFPVSGKIGKND